MRIIRTVALLLVVALVSGLAGCSQQPGQPAKEQPKSGTPAQAPAPSSGPSKPKPPKTIMSVGSGPAGSLFINFCAAFAEATMKGFDGLQMNVEPGGSSQNMQMVDKAQIEFGITSSLQTYPGYYGLSWAKGVSYKKVASVVPSYSYEGVWFTKDNSPVKSVMDLQGKTVAFGYAGGGSDVTGRQLLEFYKIKPAKIVNASWEDTGGMVRDGLVDAVFYLAGHPAGFIQELEISQKLRFIEISDADLNKFKEANPYYNIGTLKAGTYKGLTKDYKVFQGWNFMICSPDLPEDFVYNAVKSVYQNIDIIQKAHSSFKQCALENVQFMNLPLHPGAEKYYKEKGVKLPVLPPPPK
ncbi:MAG: TAXI family TRAP transporter solute-binding subunit [Firmicutes bacterium]|nr:TAXI family TRAP transporter solute-binding subunit [Bacillota bacterium]